MFMVNRRRFLTGAGALAGAVGLGGYASAYEAGSRLDLTAYDIAAPQWPADMPLKIAVIADIHACEPWMPAERIGTIVDLANAQKPDLTVLLGDFAGTSALCDALCSAGRLGRTTGPPRSAAWRLCDPGQSRLVVGRDCRPILPTTPKACARHCARCAFPFSRIKRSGSACAIVRSGSSALAINWRIA